MSFGGSSNCWANSRSQMLVIVWHVRISFCCSAASSEFKCLCYFCTIAVNSVSALHVAFLRPILTFRFRMYFAWSHLIRVVVCNSIDLYSRVLDLYIAYFLFFFNYFFMRRYEILNM